MRDLTPTPVATPALGKFLDLIAWSEGTSTSPLTHNHGYDVIVTGVDGHPEIFTDYSAHPFAHRPAKLIRPAKDGHDALFSSASGRYQIIFGTYQFYAGVLGLHDFTPASQDAIALRLIHNTSHRYAIALDPSQAGWESVFSDLVKSCSGTWASLPGNNYGQGGHTIQTLLDRFRASLTAGDRTL